MKKQIQTKGDHFVGSITVNKKSFIIDSVVYDQPIIRLEFITTDDYYITDKEKEKIGKATFKKLMKIINKKRFQVLYKKLTLKLRRKERR